MAKRWLDGKSDNDFSFSLPSELVHSHTLRYSARREREVSASGSKREGERERVRERERLREII